MTHPTHPCPPNNPHCGGTTTPPPPTTTKPNASIDNYSLSFLILAVVLITRFGYKMRSLSKIKTNGMDRR